MGWGRFFSSYVLCHVSAKYAVATIDFVDIPALPAAAVETMCMCMEVDHVKLPSAGLNLKFHFTDSNYSKPSWGVVVSFNHSPHMWYKCPGMFHRFSTSNCKPAHQFCAYVLTHWDEGELPRFSQDSIIRFSNIVIHNVKPISWEMCACPMRKSCLLIKC